MASMAAITSPQWLTTKTIKTQIPSASLTLLTGSTRRRISVSSNAANNPKACSSLLRCSFLPSSFSGLSLRMDFSSSNNGVRTGKRRGLVVRAGKAGG